MHRRPHKVPFYKRRNLRLDDTFWRKIRLLQRPQDLQNLRITRDVVHANVKHILPVKFISNLWSGIRLELVEKHSLAFIPDLEPKKLDVAPCDIALIRPNDRGLPSGRIQPRRPFAIVLRAPNLAPLKSPINMARHLPSRLRGPV